jgi:hypothetical protein
MVDLEGPVVPFLGELAVFAAIIRPLMNFSDE